MRKNMITKNSVFLLHAYALCTVFSSCNSIQSRIGNLNADIKKRNHLPPKTIEECLRSCNVEDLLKMRKVNKQWSGLASRLLVQKKKPAKIYIPGIEQFFLIENMFKRMPTLKLKYLIVERYEFGFDHHANPNRSGESEESDRPTFDDFLPFPANDKPGETTLAGLEFLDVRLDRSFHSIQGANIDPSTGCLLSNTIRLDLSNNNIGDEGAERFSMMQLPKIMKLGLYGNHIGFAGAKAISQLDLSELTRLDLANNHIGSAGAEAISQVGLPKIRKLYLDNNNIGNAGAEAISRMSILNIRKLYLANNNIGSAGAEAITTMELPNVVVINLDENHLQPSGVIALSTMHLPSVSNFYAHGNGVKHSDIIEVRKNARLNSKKCRYIEGSSGHSFSTSSTAPPVSHSDDSDNSEIEELSGHSFSTNSTAPPSSHSDDSDNSEADAVQPYVNADLDSSLSG